MEKLNLNTIYQRLKADTPVFWKKIRAIMIGAGTVGAALITLPIEYLTFLPANTPGFLITIGVVGASLASMTHDNKTN